MIHGLIFCGLLVLREFTWNICTLKTNIVKQCTYKNTYYKQSMYNGIGCIYIDYVINKGDIIEEFELKLHTVWVID